jgi:heme-degrading monooxygenase HmoA
VAIVLAQFKVADYDKWREVFESKADLRKSAGCTGTHIFRNARDGNEVIINLQWDTEENAEKFHASDAMKEALRASGVQGAPVFTFLEDAGRTAS